MIWSKRRFSQSRLGPRVPQLCPGGLTMTPIHQLVPKIKSLRLSALLETLELRNRQAAEEQLSFVDFLQRLPEDEVQGRGQKHLILRLRGASFDLEKTLEGFDLGFNPSIPH